MIIHDHYVEDLAAILCDAFPAPVLVVDEDVRIYAYNRAAEEIVGKEPRAVLERRGGDVMECLRAESTPGGCGRSEECKECILRESVGKSLTEGSVVRARHRLLRKTKDGTEEIMLLVSASPIVFQDRRLSLVVLEDISELTELRRLIPMCAVCKKVRTDDNYWVQLESYLSRHWEVAFSHGLCPECYKKEVESFHRANSGQQIKGNLSTSPDSSSAGERES